MTFSKATKDPRERNLSLAIEMSSVALTICWEAVVQENPGRSHDEMVAIFRRRLGSREMAD
ncbi:MAG TPA: hypothetical protein VMS77_04805 [Conexivisphaerales archaeon]|nr:hypothetical protein [Conexivisphaerales archaeon]